MKKYALSMAIFVAAVIGNAQAQSEASESKSNPGGIYLRGGYNLANISINDNGGVNDAKGLSSFHAGFIADIPVASIVSVQTGLLLNGQGAKSNTYFTSSTTSNYVKSSFRPLYLQVPLNLAIKFPLAPDTRLFVAGGPYVEMGLSGRSTSETNIGGVVTNSSSDIKYNNDNPTTSAQEDASYDKLKRFDFGLNFGGGIEFKNFMLGINYGLGLTKINSTQTNNSANDNNKYRTWGIGVGFKI
ncbi:porin family protein [Parasediminibacterium sp. JCM 36343]|uniref:porin family protein n=1 Tax=Parasediminibacterium sp. JCM 36343 TaxID=3374279 RepID=UPI00397A58BB